MNERERAREAAGLAAYALYGPTTEERRTLRDWRVVKNEQDRARYRNGERKKLTEGCTHGRIATYNAGCRCEQCREVARVKKRWYRTRAKWGLS